MQLLMIVMLMALSVALSITLEQIFSKISVNYISIAMGMLIEGGFILSNHINYGEFPSELFLGIIVAPLLFFEGQATHLNLVAHKMKDIIQITVVMVLICLVIAGFGVNFITGVSLPLAFVLAAISTPTDATATESVTNGLKIPKKEGTLLKLESLFNDASGIILLNMAMLWYLNGKIAYGITLKNFVVSSVGGAMFGLIIAWLIVLFRQMMVRSSYNSVTAQEIIFLFTPAVIFFLAEEFHLSGIIAVVCAGLVHNAEHSNSRMINPQQIQAGRNMQRLVTEVFNSFVFITLGMLLIGIIFDPKITYPSNLWILIGVILYVANVGVRYFFGRITFQMDNKAAWIFSLGGVHGTVTLALAYMVAEMNFSKKDFNLILMSESVLIVLSMLVPTIVFRFILDKEKDYSEAKSEIEKLRAHMVQAAIDEVNKIYVPKKIKETVIFELNAQKQTTRTKDFIKAWKQAVRHPEFSIEEKEMEMRAFFLAFSKEREYLDMVSQKESSYRKYVFYLYNEILQIEALIVDDYIEE